MDDLFVFTDVGKEIKTIATQSAKSIFVIMVILGCLVAITGIVALFSSFLMGLLIVVAGVLIIVFGYFIARRSAIMMYAFGEIVDHVMSIDSKIKQTEENAVPTKSVEPIYAVNNSVYSIQSRGVPSDKKPATAPANQWVCTCGRKNFHYVTSCVCGMSRSDVAAQNKKAPQ